MPRSKRDKQVSLTKVSKKGKDQKVKLIDEVRQCVSKFSDIYIFSVENMRNTKIKEVKRDWKDSRITFGKTKVMQLALGRTKEEAQADNLHKVSKRLTGQRGLIFTNRSKEEVFDYFQTFREPDFARSGNAACETVDIPAGALPQFSHALEPSLRSLGVPTKLNRGVVTLTEDFTICNEGDVLTPEQAKLLKLFDKPIVEFSVVLICRWSKPGRFETYVKRGKTTGSKSKMDVS